MHKTFFKSDILPPKKVKKIWKPKPRKATGERELFLEVWNSRPHECEMCRDEKGNPTQIKIPQSFCFAHQWGKGVHKKERLDPLNIVLVCSLECHAKVDAQRKYMRNPGIKK